jgi:hypothetical protein
MKLNTLYNKYFQKSKVFIYPLLGIKKGNNIVPKETYIIWNSTISIEDMRLICLYEITKSETFTIFEKKILNHPRLCDYIQVNENTVLFAFDFCDLGDDWSCFIDGKYSLMSMSVKRKILDFFDKKSNSFMYIQSFLYPNKWFSEYASLLDVDIDTLKAVGELCDKPNLNKEKLILVVENLENTKILN